MNDESKNDALLGGTSPGPMSICPDAFKTVITKETSRSVFIHSVIREITKKDGVWRRTTGVAH
jgi:hypothetical protein